MATLAGYFEIRRTCSTRPFLVFPLLPHPPVERIILIDSSFVNPIPEIHIIFRLSSRQYISIIFICRLT
jgi:hypothetical protein